MIFFNYLNIILSVALIFWPVIFAHNVLGLRGINPFYILVIVSFPVEIMKLIGGPLILIDDGLMDIGYQYAVFMSNIYATANLIGAIFFYKMSKNLHLESYLPGKNITFNKVQLILTSRIFTLVYVLSMLILASSEFGILNWIANPREGYQLYRTGQGHWYALATSSLSIAFTLALLAKPYANSIILNTIFFLFMAYFLGTKGMLLAIFTTTLIFLWFLRLKNFNRTFMLGMPIIFALLIFNLYLARGDGFELSSVVEYFDYFTNAAEYYRSYLNQQVELFHGEIILSSFWSYVPRFIWSDKPVIYGILHINNIFFPGMAELTNTPAFGGAVEQFADFGILGVVLFGIFSSKALLTGIFSYFIFTRPGLNLDRVSLAAIFVILIQFSPAFGNYFPSGLYILFVFFIIFFINICRNFHRFMLGFNTSKTRSIKVS